MRGHALRLGLAASLLLALGLGAAAAGRSDGSTRVAPAATAAPVDDRVSLVTGGVLTPLAAGQVIDVAGELTAVITIGREPGVRYIRVLSIRLADAAATVGDATVTIAGHMLTMDHGSFVVTATPSAGTYIARLPFVMPGEWQLDVHVVASKGSGDFSLEIDELD